MRKTTEENKDRNNRHTVRPKVRVTKKEKHVVRVTETARQRIKGD